MAKILVTGAAGFIGSHTTDRLLADGHTVLGVDNFRTGHRRNLTAALESPAFGLREADVAEAGVVDALVAEFRPDAIIHLAALVSVQESIQNPALNRRLNLTATELVADAAAAHGVKRVVFASSAAIYGDTTNLPIREETTPKPISPYGEAKLASEGILLGRAGLTVRCHRYFNVFGPRQDPASPYSGVISIFERRYREGKGVTIYGDGQQTRDFISVHDVARANAIAATGPGIASGVANICTGRPTSLREVVGIFALHYPAAPAPQFAPGRPGDIIHSLGRPDRAKAEIGFVAQVPVAEGLAELIRVG
ncbi:MAG: NAD-dependent epimerase/dehydratase family protein [Opitutaceae bacterium]|nr:NAD-dependent epimerase/dehydratase family protein [Opitutaceae bacterium]MBP9912899.1 NAD-dependent epimerase/dehydratase family protein [Opitutaceae bacterium]